MKTILKNKKGVAGLNMYLSLIAMLFMIGIIVMVFQIAGAELADSQRETSTRATISDETLLTVNNTAQSLTVAGYSSASCSLLAVMNVSSANSSISSGNYTFTGCTIASSGDEFFNFTTWGINYTYTYLVSTPASEVINSSRDSIKSAIDWFPTFIVLGALVVLILLVVIIINSIRQTGLVQEGA